MNGRIHTQSKCKDTAIPQTPSASCICGYVVQLDSEAMLPLQLSVAQPAERREEMPSNLSLLREEISHKMPTKESHKR